MRTDLQCPKVNCHSYHVIHDAKENEAICRECGERRSIEVFEEYYQNSQTWEEVDEDRMRISI